MRKNILLGIILMTCMSSIVKAEDIKSKFNPIWTSVVSQTIAPDARAASMGDIGVSTMPDANSQAWNAAKYPFAISRAGLSINYTPWLRQLVNDIDLAYIAGYIRLGDYQAISGSVRYFSLGEVQTDNSATVKPYEYAVDIAYSRLLSEKFSAAVALRYMYSDLSGNYNDQSTGGSAFAADLGFYYNDYIIMGSRECQLAVGLNISNIGSKINFGSDYSYFIPTTLRLGASYAIPINQYSRISFSLEANKLLVPTMPIQREDESAEDYETRLQKDFYDVSSIGGIFKSFGDAPGGFKEELQEIQWSIGTEYVYNEKFSLRAGYHHQSANKGNLKYFTVGAGFKMNVFAIDAGYVISTAASNPLDQTIRVSLTFDFDGIKDLFSRK